MLATLALLASLAAAQTRVVDRIEAVVNGQPVLASEVSDAAWYARLSSGADCGPALSASERATALRHLEDAVLLEAAAAAEGFAPPEESTAAATLRRLAPRLEACHLEAAAAKDLIGRQIRILGYLDLHFAGQAAPGKEQIEAYYRDTFTPTARAHGLAVAPLAAVHDTIAKLLLQQQRIQEEQQWLARLRAEATIEVIAPW